MQGKLDHLTSNEFYRGVNRRFDRRASQLRSLGYVLEVNPELSLGYFVKRSRMFRAHAIPSAVLSHASNRAWREVYLLEASKRQNCA